MSFKTVILTLVTGLSVQAHAFTQCGGQIIEWGKDNVCAAQMWANGGVEQGFRTVVSDALGRGDAQIICTHTGWVIESSHCESDDQSTLK